VQPADGNAIEVDVSLEAAPAVLYDALVLPDGDEAVTALRADGRTLEFINDPAPPLQAAVGATISCSRPRDRDSAANGQPDPV
jgi:hypothetical protein